MINKICILTILILFQLSCSGQIKDIKKLEDFKFESIFGYFESDSSNTYCLLGQGYFRTPRSDNSDSLLNQWLVKNPDALVIPISSMGPTMTADPDSKMTYCWIVSKSDTLNLYLIKQGCFSGGTMQKPTLRGMKPPIFGSYGLFENIRMRREHNKMMQGEKAKVKDYIRKRDYNSFIERLIQAEKYAKDNNLGIWNEKTNEINK